jgi:chemotaxis protein histidine kinase CheA
MIYNLHVLPREALNDGQRTIPLGDPAFFAQAVGSIARWIANVEKVPVLREHNRELGHMGRVLGVYTNDQGMYAQVELDHAPHATYASAHVVWNYTDNRGVKWPAALLELSVVSVPQFYVGQTELSPADQTFASVMSNPLVPHGEQMEDEMEEKLKELMDRIAALEAAVPAATEKTEEVKVEKTEEETEVESKLAEPEETTPPAEVELTDAAMLETALSDLAAAHAEIAQLKAELAAAKGEAEAEASEAAEDAELESMMAAAPYLKPYRAKLKGMDSAARQALVSSTKAHASVMGNRKVPAAPPAVSRQQKSVWDTMLDAVTAAEKTGVDPATLLTSGKE